MAISRIRRERLTNDYKALQRLCAFNEPVKIKILETGGNPPEYYRIRLSNCKGVESVNGNTPKYRTEHILIVDQFSEKYPDPGELPRVKLESPIYHPNVYSNGKFCFQGKDISEVVQPLDALVHRIVSMIQYKNLRFGTPANADAKDWAERNTHLFPLKPNTKSSLNWR